MLRKQNILLTISLCLLTAASFFYVWFTGRSSNHVIDKNIFQVSDWSRVDRAVLTSASQSIRLNYTGSRWQVNETWNADRNMMDVLFATLQQVQPQRPVALQQNDSVILALKQDGVKVTLFEKEQAVLTFYAGGNITKQRAYFVKEGDTQAYVMQIPGYRVYVSGIFELDENGWRDKYVFGFNWRNFQRLAASFTDSKNNFHVSMQDRYFGVEGMSEADTTRLNDYLDAVSLLTVDEYVSMEKAQVDSVARLAPTVTIKVADIGGKIYKLALFAPVASQSKVLGLVDDKQPAWFDPRKVRLLFMPKEAFRMQK